MLSKFLQLVKLHQYRIFLSVCMILLSFISYNLGKISSSEKPPLRMGESANIYSAVREQEQLLISGTPVPAKVLDTRVVASKASSTKKYHYTWCPGAKQIKEENKIWFVSDKEAESRGYALAGNCEK